MFEVDFSWTMSLLFSSLLSLAIGTIVGLTQSRIKRLYAFSTISHVGFILLALSIHSIESTQAFMFYLMQYSISNLNAFILIITIGYSLYCYVYEYDGKDNEPSLESPLASSKKVFNDISDTLLNKEEEHKKNEETAKDTDESSQDVDLSPIQLIGQLKGYYYINPVLSLSLAITLFSFAGIPPLIGFFAKQMVLSAAIDSGYIFMSLVAILTSVISAVYYLAIVKQMFFDKPDYILAPQLKDFSGDGLIAEKNDIIKEVNIKIDNIVVSSSLSLSISIVTFIISLFIFIPQE
jgi:NADH-ubiquinone oxidoreductase chain 2